MRGPEAGDVIEDRYELQDVLGKGGFGIVFSALDRILNRQVAIKFLREPDDADAKARLFREADAIAQLSHDNICEIYDVNKDECFIVMKLIRGRLLRDYMFPRLEPAIVVSIALQVAHALEAAHQNPACPIFHRDIKPANIMVGAENRVTVMDFGLAFRKDQTRLTAKDAAVGTRAYMSPEQYLGDTITERTDIWSLGVVMYEMLTLVLPFSEPTRREHGPPKPITDYQPELSTLDAIVQKALEYRPEERYASASELAAKLLGWLNANASFVPHQRPVFLDTSVLLNILFQPDAEDVSEIERCERARDAFDAYRDLYGVATSQTIMFELLESAARVLFDCNEFSPSKIKLVVTFIEETKRELAAVKRCEPTRMRWDELTDIDRTFFFQRVRFFFQGPLSELANQLAPINHTLAKLVQQFLVMSADGNTTLRDTFTIAAATAANARIFCTEDPTFDTPEYRKAVSLYGAMEIDYLSGAK